ncbi:NlpC/P60 family protein [Clostridiaceae bacterium HFYG-1003]|nr:NlpC/P60 family protein [Clostridiaceae bacterium HFYG-1003]
MKKRNSQLKVLAAALVAAATLLAPLTGAIAEATTLKAKSNVNVRASSSSTSEKVGYVTAGSIHQYLGTENGWYKIDLNGLVGYTYRDYWQANTLTARSNVNVRKSANNQAEKVFYAQAGTEALVLGRSASWLYLEINGTRGYSYKSYWDLSDVLFYSLPVVTGDAGGTITPVDPAPAPLPPAPTNPENIAAGDQYKVFTSISGYLTAADAQAGTNSTRKVAPGTYVVYKVFSGMYNVSTTNGVPGSWVNPETNVAQLPPTEPSPPTDPGTEPTEPRPIEAGDQYKVLAPLAGYYTAAEAAEGGTPLTVLPAGTYYIYKIFSGMYNLSATQGTPGAWINPAMNNGTATPTPDPSPDNNELGDRVVAIAKTLIGAPYVYAGESWEEGGFDCSGLTYYSYNKVGIRIPRTASTQWAGIANKVSVPRPGDIIAFEKDGKVYHVGIYIGNNQMIHSPKPGDYVKIVDLTWYYKNNLVKGFLRPTP